MTVENIIKAVRWCIDEEALNVAGIADVSAYDFGAGDEGLMNNIIKAKIGDAIRWICLYAPAELLGGTDEPDTTEQSETIHHPTGILVDVEPETSEIISIIDGVCARVYLPDNFIKLSRVRCDGWHRSVKEPLREDSDEYLQLYDDNGATATYDRPQVAIIDCERKQLEIWPYSKVITTAHPEVDKVYYTYVASVDLVPFNKPKTGGGTEVAYALPPRVKTAFIYYLAFLLLSAYEDSRAARMLEIAKMNIGK